MPDGFFLPKGQKFVWDTDGRLQLAPPLMGRMLGVAPVNENGEIDDDGDAEGNSVGAFWGPMPSHLFVEADLKTPELLAGERGIVLSVPVKRCTQLGQPDSVNYKTRVDTMELRSALLLWDKIDCPKNDLIVLSRGSDLCLTRN